MNWFDRTIALERAKKIKKAKAEGKALTFKEIMKLPIKARIKGLLMGDIWMKGK